MKSANQKILMGALSFGCAIACIGGVSVISEKAAGYAVPVSVMSEQKPPVIILDAGHGGQT